MMDLLVIIIPIFLSILTVIASLSMFILKDIKTDMEKMNDRLVNHISDHSIHQERIA